VGGGWVERGGGGEGGGWGGGGGGGGGKVTPSYKKTLGMYDPSGCQAESRGSYYSLSHVAHMDESCRTYE